MTYDSRADVTADALNISARNDSVVAVWYEDGGWHNSTVHDCPARLRRAPSTYYVFSDMILRKEP